MIEYFQLSLRNAFDFQSRSRRKEYWYFVLMQFFIGVGFTVLQMIVGFNSVTANLLAGLSALVSLLLFVPGLAVAVRRLHDVGRSGWWLLLAIVPLIGPIVLIVWFATDGESNPNQWGPNPKASFTSDDDESLDRLEFDIK
mgnify:CR=1 FL=1